MPLLLFSLKQTILVLAVITIGVLPLYGQANSQADIFKAAAQLNQNGPCFGVSEEERIPRPGYTIRNVRPEASSLRGVRLDLGKVALLEFITRAAERPVNGSSGNVVAGKADTQTNSLRYEGRDAGERRDAGETSEAGEADLQTNSSRYETPEAGETPAVPVKRWTPETSTDANQGNQTANDPYVFPTPKERFNRYLKSMFGLSALIRSAVNAGISQWKDSPEEWEQGMSGYGKRYVSSFGQNAIRHTVTYGLDSALGWDTGFRRSPSKEFGERLKHALLEHITSRTRSGKRVISVPRIAGAYTAGVISRETWYPERYTWKDGLRSGTNSLLFGFAYNVVREFVVKF